MLYTTVACKSLLWNALLFDGGGKLCSWMSASHILCLEANLPAYSCLSSLSHCFVHSTNSALFEVMSRQNPSVPGILRRGADAFTHVVTFQKKLFKGHLMEYFYTGLESWNKKTCTVSLQNNVKWEKLSSSMEKQNLARSGCFPWEMEIWDPAQHHCALGTDLPGPESGVHGLFLSVNHLNYKVALGRLLIMTQFVLKWGELCSMSLGILQFLE